MSIWDIVFLLVCLAAAVAIVLNRHPHLMKKVTQPSDAALGRASSTTSSAADAPKHEGKHDKGHDHKHHSTGVKWQHVFLVLALVWVGFKIAGVFVVGTAGSNFERHRLPSANFASTPPKAQVKTCPESETLAPGEISSTFENAPDGENLSMLPNLNEGTVVIYIGSTGRLCGPETANTDRWCVKNISDKPVVFSCSK